MINRAKNGSRAMCRLASLLLITAAALPVQAGTDVYVYRDKNGDSVRLLAEPCKTASGWLKMNHAEVRFQGKVYQACWVFTRGTVIVVDEDGDVAQVPAAYFAKENQT